MKLIEINKEDIKVGDYVSVSSNVRDDVSIHIISDIYQVKERFTGNTIDMISLMNLSEEFSLATCQSKYSTIVSFLRPDDDLANFKQQIQELANKIEKQRVEIEIELNQIVENYLKERNVSVYGSINSTDTYVYRIDNKDVETLDDMKYKLREITGEY